MEKDTSAARKRRSVNIMLGARSAKKVKSTFEENVDDQDDANENMDNISSPACSGADPMVCEAMFVEFLSAQVCISYTCDIGF